MMGKLKGWVFDFPITAHRFFAMDPCLRRSSGRYDRMKFRSKSRVMPAADKSPARE